MKNVLIVGAGKGIGLACAQLLKDEYTLYTVSRTLTSELEALNTRFYQAETGVDSLDNLYLPDELHGLVYCPGSIQLKPFHRFSTQDFIADYRQNVLGAVETIQKALPALKKSAGASIVLFSSVAATTGMPFHSSIAASKAAVEGLARSLAAELASSKIRVNVVAPSLTDTPLATPLLSTIERREAAAKRHPLGTIGDPSDIGAMVAFLLSVNSRWITGQVLNLDGGMSTLRC